MKIINTKIDGDISITEDTDFLGLTTGDMIAEGQITLNVHGLVSKNLIIKEKTTVNVYGIIDGDILNEGKVNIFGIINGRVVNKNGQIFIDEKAIVKG